MQILRSENEMPRRCQYFSTRNREEFSFHLSPREIFCLFTLVTRGYVHIVTPDPLQLLLIADKNISQLDARIYTRAEAKEVMAGRCSWPPVRVVDYRAGFLG